MATDYYPTRNLEWKLKMWDALDEQGFSGNTVRIQTAPGVVTEFDPKTMSPDTLKARLLSSILADDGFDMNNPVHAKFAKLVSPGRTRANFIS